MAAVAALAVALRCWRLAWGLDLHAWFPDEQNVWPERISAFVPLTWGSFLPSGRLFYPTLYSTVAGLVAWAAAHLGWSPDPDPHGRVTAAILIARGVSAAASVATVAVTGVLGARTFGTGAGLLAAALMAVAPVEVMQAHFVSVDTLLVLCMTLAVLAACRVAATGSVGAVVGAAVAAGCAFATKYSGLASVSVVGWAIVEDAWRRRSARRLVPLGVLALAVGVVTAVAASPVLLTRWGDVTREMAFLRFAAAQGGGGNSAVAPSLGWYGRPRIYQLVVGLPYALGWSFHLVALAGVALAIARGTAADRLLLVAMVPYYLAVTSSPSGYHRYLMPLVPPLAVLAARALVAGERWRRLRVAAAVAVVLHTLVYTASLLPRLSLDQHVGAVTWLRAHGPWRSSASLSLLPKVEMPDALVLWTGFPPFFGQAHLPLTFAPWGHWLESRPDAFLLPEWVAVYARRTPPSAEAVRQLDALESGAAGYREAARWDPSWFLHEDLYGWLDPGLRTEWYGRTGVRIYVAAGALRR